MSDRVSKSEFKAKALEYFRLVEKSGETLVVTDHGHPVLEVRPYRAKNKDPFRLLQGSLLRYDAPTEPVGDEWDAA